MDSADPKLLDRNGTLLTNEENKSDINGNCNTKSTGDALVSMPMLVKNE